MCVLVDYVGRRLRVELACTRVKRVILINLWTAAIITPVFEGDKGWTDVKRTTLVLQYVYVEAAHSKGRVLSFPVAKGLRSWIFLPTNEDPSLFTPKTN